ncbi:MAG TPA: peptidyl-prolyl cis-trans isomerase [Opitutaceae bacterium]|nr:peptidyl-prolyl cis-trans isomerase [Opitutaceae bacterium]
MISWIQQTFQQHFRIALIVVLGVIIVAFVFTIGAAPGFGPGSTKAMNRPFFGVNLGNQEDVRRVLGDAQVSVYLQVGYPALDGARLEQYALQRYAALTVANDLRLPAPTSSEVTEFVKTRGAFAGQDGNFDAARYAQFRDSLKMGGGMTESDVARVISDDFRYDRLQKLLAGPGYVLPNDIKQELVRGDTRWTLGVASVDYAAFSPKIETPDAELAKFFEENVFRYEIQPQVRVRVVDFPVANYAAQVRLTDAEVRAYYNANPARFPKPAAVGADGKPSVQLPTPDANPDADFAAVKSQVEAALTLEKARHLSGEAASNLTLALYEGKVTRAQLDAFLAGRGLTAKPIPPFGRDAAPPELMGSSDVAGEAFKLNEGRFFSDAVGTASGNVVLLWEENVPARQPQLAEVRARVVADFTENEKRKKFVEAGRAAKAQVEARLKAGDSFEKAVATAAAAAGFKAEVKTPAAFTLREPDRELAPSVIGSLETLQKGSVSELVLSGNQGTLVYVIDRQVPAIDDSNPRYSETRTQIAQVTAARVANEQLGAYVEKELAKSAPINP